MSEKTSNFRTVNRILGAQPNLGPIPGNQIIPWCFFLLFSYVIGKGLLQLDWLYVGFIALWLISTWWILTWNQPWRFLSKFLSVPTPTMGYARYQSILQHHIYERKNRKKGIKRRR
jgi:hypothetical protein